MTWTLGLARDGRALLAPEVVQTSSMDCGPAALKCLLEGFGIHVSYGRLREACQTEVDGTSISVLEEVASQLGLEVEQAMVPTDHLLLPEAEVLPALLLTRLPGGLTHFAVAWRLHGGRVQLMDPSTGRRWPTRARLLRDVYVHQMEVEGPAFREFAASEGMLRPLRALAARVGAVDLDEEIRACLADPRWCPLAALDAAVRMTGALVRAGGVREGEEARAMIRGLAGSAAEAPATIPPQYWFARPGEGEDRVELRGAVLLKISGRREAQAGAAPQPLPRELAEALREAPPAPGRELLRLLRADGLLHPVALSIGLGVAALGTGLEALIFRGLLDLRERLGPIEQRAGALAGAGAFLLALLLLEVGVADRARGLGRRLEVRLRLAFLEKLPRVADRYFHSRSTSDMAERGHSLHRLRAFPLLGSRLLRGALALAATAAGLAWLDPASVPLAVVGAALAVAMPLALQPPLLERDLRLRTQTASLGRFYLDALLGLVPLRAHGAERAVRREHEALLSEWTRAGRALVQASVGLDALQGTVGLAVAIGLVATHALRSGDQSGALLLAYWALQLPVLGREIAMAVRTYPAQRSQALRLGELLGALEEERDPRSVVAGPPPAEGAARGVAVSLECVTTRAGGHPVLEDVSLEVARGEQVAVVGASGAGKSTLVGLLLGWHRPSEGALRVDGAPLDAVRLQALRARTAWVDPAVQLWNRSLLDNVRYGAPEQALPFASLIGTADLKTVIDALPDGLQTPLGEGGALVSGGEGQRIRLARAMARAGADLVILDEPFRGLDRPRRERLLRGARELWRGATLFCVTHDIRQTLDFDRVLVVEGGRIVEAGAPSALAGAAGGRYRALLEAEERLRQTAFEGERWRRLVLEDGQVRS